MGVQLREWISIDRIRCIDLFVKNKMDTFLYTEIQVIISAPGVKKI